MCQVKKKITIRSIYKPSIVLTPETGPIKNKGFSKQEKYTITLILCLTRTCSTFNEKFSQTLDNGFTRMELSKNDKNKNSLNK